MAKESKLSSQRNSCTSAYLQEQLHPGVDRRLCTLVLIYRILKRCIQGPRLIKLVIFTTSSIIFLNEKWHFGFIQSAGQRIQCLLGTTTLINDKASTILTAIMHNQYRCQSHVISSYYYEKSFGLTVFHVPVKVSMFFRVLWSSM